MKLIYVSIIFHLKFYCLTDGPNRHKHDKLNGPSIQRIINSCLVYVVQFHLIDEWQIGRRYVFDAVVQLENVHRIVSLWIVCVCVNVFIFLYSLSLIGLRLRHFRSLSVCVCELITSADWYRCCSSIIGRPAYTIYNRIWRSICVCRSGP